MPNGFSTRGNFGEISLRIFWVGRPTLQFFVVAFEDVFGLFVKSIFFCFPRFDDLRRKKFFEKFL